MTETLISEQRKELASIVAACAKEVRVTTQAFQYDWLSVLRPHFEKAFALSASPAAVGGDVSEKTIWEGELTVVECATKDEIAALRGVIASADDECKRTEGMRWGYFSAGGWGGLRLRELLTRLESPPHPFAGIEPFADPAIGASLAMADVSMNLESDADKPSGATTRARNVTTSSNSNDCGPAAVGTGTRERERRIAEIEGRLRRASVGPWQLDERFPNCVYCDDELGSRVADCNASHAMILREEGMAANADFIANAPTDVAWLIAQIECASSDAVSGSETAND